jgi:uncharacterized protein (TIGR03086 family)
MDAAMYERALDRTKAVVAGTRRDQLDDPTPCTDWDVHALLNHIIGGLVTFASGADGKAVPMSDGTDHVADDHVAAFERAATEALYAFKAPGALERDFTLPWGESPAMAALGLALADAVVHGWDLAQATGQDITIDDDAAEAIYGMTSGMMEPKGSYPRGDAFKDPVEVSDGAAPAARMLAYLGRTP